MLKGLAQRAIWFSVDMPDFDSQQFPSFAQTEKGYRITIRVFPTIAGTQDVGLANADNFNAHQGQLLTITAPGVLQNDTDEEGDALTTDLVSDVSHGSLTLNANGSFSYTSDSQFTGNDSFTYRVYDGEGYSDPVTVTLSVTNGVPVANDDFYSVHQGLSLYGAASVLGNDTSSYSLTAELVSDVSYGTLYFNSDGTVDYYPDSGYAGPDSFTYKAYDGTDYSNTVTVAIDVQNAVPVAISNGYSVHQGQSLTGAASVLGNDIDDDSDTLTAELVSDVSNGTLYFNSDGTFDYYPYSEYAGSDSFTYRVYDGAEYSNTVTVTIAVEALATIDGLVWEDTNGDGIQDGGEYGFYFVEVQLLDASNNVLDTVYTDMDGIFEFRVQAGSYKLKVINPNTSTYVFTDQFAGDEDEDSDADSSGIIALFSLEAGEFRDDLDAGLKEI
jgi:VCBS repeat-containing protein